MQAAKKPQAEKSVRAAHAPLFSISGVSKVYQSGDVAVHALRGVDATLYEGELAVMLGPSGSGKSTLLNILGGLDTATSGSIHFRDEELTKLSDRKLTLYRRDHVGFVFQFYNLVPSLTARENVALVTEIAKKPMKPEDALYLVGLESRMSHFPAQLSGGEQQRVAIARAIVTDPVVVLADEPTGNLDRSAATRTMELLRQLVDEFGKTLVMVTHDPLAAKAADRVVHLDKGRIVAEDAHA
jgi:putative ABC transport system ATP-binding protein